MTGITARGWRKGILLGAGVAVMLAACNGFPKPAPITEAEHRPEKYPTYAPSPPVQLIAVDSQRFMVLPGATTTIASNFLQPAGTSTLLSLRWNHAPFSTLYQRASDGRLHEAFTIR